jgi:hypothetical protein
MGAGSRARSKWGGAVSLREQIRAAAMEGRNEELSELARNERRAVRHLMGLSYEQNPEIRARAAEALGVAAMHHKKLMDSNIRRLVWAMNDESGTNALTAPEVLLAIARKNPELLLPVVPDLARLAADEGLREGLAATLQLVRDACPGEVGPLLGRSINERFEDGGRCAS